MARLVKAVVTFLKADDGPTAVEYAVLAVFLVGGTLGGIAFGSLADRIGRKPTMVATILFDARRKTVKHATDLKESAEMHRRIYRAVRERKPEAARLAMRDHLMLAQRAQEAEGIDYSDAESSEGNGAGGNHTA